MAARTFFLSFPLYRDWDFSKRCARGQDSVNGLEKCVSKCDDGALVAAASSEGVIARLQA